MGRTKEYNEAEVVEKAMNLFWRNGYENTSMQLLEKEMGINKFSIYSSFESKEGILIESIKCYEKKLAVLIEKLEKSNNGLDGIKQYFYDLLVFIKDAESVNGCFVTNTLNEVGLRAEKKLMGALQNVTLKLKSALITNLSQDHSSDEEVEKLANYYLVSIFGMTSAAKVFSSEQIDDYLQNIFKHV